MNPQPTTNNIISACVLGLCLIACGLLLTHGGRNLPATTSGILDNDYTEDHGSHGSVSYEVKYTFQVNGTQYRGSDTLYDKPNTPEHRVYYDPKAPNENALSSSPPDGKKILIAIVVFVVAMVAYSTLPIHPNAPVPQGAGVHQNGLGDAAGEHLTMEGGRYPATFYVGLAFFGQVAVTAYLVWFTLFLLPGGRINGDLAIAVAVICGLGATLLIYWDRWKCTTVTCSRYCSGCANLSVLYVPIVAFCYANWRGLMKLTQR
jgi:hypothetical protein